LIFEVVKNKEVIERQYFKAYQFIYNILQLIFLKLHKTIIKSL